MYHIMFAKFMNYDPTIKRETKLINLKMYAGIRSSKEEFDFGNMT